MTVGELRAELNSFGDDTEIQVQDCDNGFPIWIEATEIEVVNSGGKEFVRIFGA